REVPLLMPWDGQIMEGVIDLIYEHDGLLYLADYKTDRIAREKLTEGAARYRQQAHIYSSATRQSLHREVTAFNVIFLRLGEAVRGPSETTNQFLPPFHLTLLGQSLFRKPNRSLRKNHNRKRPCSNHASN